MTERTFADDTHWQSFTEIINKMQQSDVYHLNVLHKYKLVYHTFLILKQRMNMTIVFNQM